MITAHAFLPTKCLFSDQHAGAGSAVQLCLAQQSCSKECFEGTHTGSQCGHNPIPFQTSQLREEETSLRKHGSKKRKPRDSMCCPGPSSAGCFLFNPHSSKSIHQFVNCGTPHQHMTHRTMAGTIPSTHTWNGVNWTPLVVVMSVFMLL